MPATSPRGRARRGLEDLLGHDRPLPGQVEAIAAALEGRDVLAVLPTGGGKSSIYQVAAALIDGPTVVVSPLIALQDDQHRALDDLDVGDAAVANASVTERARRELFEAVVDGDVEFLLLAPEQLRRTDTLEGLRAARPSVFVATRPTASAPGATTRRRRRPARTARLSSLVWRGAPAASAPPPTTRRPRWRT